MDGFVLTAALCKIAYAVVGVLAMLQFSAWLDRRAGINFRRVMEEMREDRLAAAVYLGARILALGILFAALAGCSAAQAGTFPTRYDGQIRSAVARYWPDHPDWLAWKAQLYQESRLRPEAVSPAGARGLAQFMPATWQDISRELRLGAVSPHAEIAIEAGAYYMAKLRRAWVADRAAIERQRLAQASYNAGLRNILAAQRRCGDARLWAGIAPCLAQVTGPPQAAETLGYVAAIARWRAMMAAEGAG